MVRKAHLPVLCDEPIKEHEKGREDFLDLLLLAETLLDLAVVADDSSGDTARLLLDAPGPFPVLLKASGHGDEILATTGAAGVVILENLDKRLQGIMLLSRLWCGHIRVQLVVAGKGALVIPHPPGSDAHALAFFNERVFDPVNLVISEAQPRIPPDPPIAKPFLAHAVFFSLVCFREGAPVPFLKCPHNLFARGDAQGFAHQGAACFG